MAFPLEVEEKNCMVRRGMAISRINRRKSCAWEAFGFIVVERVSSGTGTSSEVPPEKGKSLSSLKAILSKKKVIKDFLPFFHHQILIFRLF
ncbi:hypothetical protein [uncultured Desulfovibrio sp.]|uniref:hypothetical protein n=1 Tax=uncultured Desulfovibrio sp. TaxID=167968 RepID=UPI002602F4EC|nr:hypothetical protein [uncultured Desulfovibrio sp.]